MTKASGGTAAPAVTVRRLSLAGVTAARLETARAILADAQAEALDLINAILYDLALTMPGASVPEVIAVLPGPEQEAVHELIDALG